jgi:dihydroorotate dehydrogenase
LFSYENLKKVLFKLEPENAHNVTEFALKCAGNFPQVLSPFVERNFVIDDRLKQDIFGKEFINPVGLGAGFDKNGTMIKAMMALGFGYTEVGTVTPVAQPGNEKPRMFRYPEHESVQNAMGFNNGGSYELQKRVKDVYPFSIPIGVNIGKNKTTPQAQALDDYKHLIKSFKDICDYLVINISSPNTPNLRDLQNEEFIKSLFGMSKELTDKPILLKIAPDMEADVALELCNTAIDSGANGIIATNTTVDYDLLDGCQDFGGLSGKVLQEKSYELFKAIAKELYGKTLLISVGGIDSAEEAYKRIKAGASLVQVYSALVFHGPSLIKNINEGIIELLEEDGYKHISEAIGADLK